MIVGVQPTTFPQKSAIDGTEEIYTQTGGVNQKFTVGQVTEHVLAQLGAGSVVETVMIPLVVQDMDIPYDNGAHTTVSKVFIPSAAILHPAATKVRAKIVFGVTLEFEYQASYYNVSNDALGQYHDGAIVVEAPADGFTDFVETDWFTPQTNCLSWIGMNNEVVQSQTDALTLLHGSVLIIQAYTD